MREKYNWWQWVVLALLACMSAAATQAVFNINIKTSAPTPSNVSANLTGPTKWIIPDSDWRVGDCFTYYYVTRESWDDPPMIRRIEEIGRLSYRVSMYAHDMWWPGILAAPMSDRKYMQHVECPE